MNGLGMVKVHWDPCDAWEHSDGLNVNLNRNNETHAGSRLNYCWLILKVLDIAVITY